MDTILPPRGQSGTPNPTPSEIVKLVTVPVIPGDVVTTQIKEIASAAVAEGVQQIKEQSLSPIQPGMPPDWGKLKYDAAKILVTALSTAVMLGLYYLASRLSVPLPLPPQ